MLVDVATVSSLTLREGKAPNKRLSHWGATTHSASFNTHAEKLLVLHCNYFHLEWNAQSGYTSRPQVEKQFPLGFLTGTSEASSLNLPIKQKHSLGHSQGWGDGVVRTPSSPRSKLHGKLDSHSLPPEIIFKSL